MNKIEISCENNARSDLTHEFLQLVHNMKNEQNLLRFNETVWNNGFESIATGDASELLCKIIAEVDRYD